MAEDYSTAFFIWAFVVVFMALVAIHATWGFAVALLAGLAAGRLIGRG